MSRRRSRGRHRGRLVRSFCIIFGISVLAAGAVLAGITVQKRMNEKKPEELLTEYMSHIENQEYDAMYAMVDVQSSRGIDEEKFTTRNANIYEGMEVRNVRIQVTGTEKNKNLRDRMTVFYETAFDTAAGEVSFSNEADFKKGEDGYGLIWEDRVIYPGLTETDKVRVKTTQAERGQILDRNGRLLAGPGVASSVGIVPGKLENQEEVFGKLSELLEISVEAIEKKLSAKWVKEDSFVPVRTLPKVDELKVMSPDVSEELLAEKAFQDELLTIPGVMITDVDMRVYPFEEAAAHLVGYVQSVTAEDLEKHAGEGYTAASVIGRSGMEALYEKELKGQNGCEIYITNRDGQRKETLAKLPVQDGEDIHLTIDVRLQTLLYARYQEDKSCSAAMNPYTGEVLALVSTPAYDNNEFIRGMTEGRWAALNEDESHPLMNRFRQTWCPGSSFKPVIGAIGLDTGSFTAQEDFGRSGLSWQKDSSWGSYYVTALHDYEPAVLENALIYSDNIYFAKAALKIGTQKLASALERLGFGQELPFDIVMSKSQYTNGETIESEVQLADTGYGQGQVLVNPLHLACLYTAFINGGDGIKPYLRYQEKAEPEVWLPQAFSEESAACILEGLKKVVNDPHGTGYGTHREDLVLAGKTGTAEIKASKDDDTGTELGWLAVFTTERTVPYPILMVTMVEDVKGRGGSGYVVDGSKAVLDTILTVQQ